MRAEGYYRVKIEAGWMVAKWHDNHWIPAAHSEPNPEYNDRHFSEIDERRIPMPDEAVGIEKILSELSVIARDAIDSDGFFSSSEFEEYAGELIFAKILKH